MYVLEQKSTRKPDLEEKRKKEPNILKMRTRTNKPDLERDQENQEVEGEQGTYKRTRLIRKRTRGPSKRTS